MFVNLPYNHAGVTNTHRPAGPGKRGYMDQAVMEKEAESAAHKEHDVAAAVITPVGVYPDDEAFRRADEKTVVNDILRLAAEKLKITNTTDWVAKVDGNKINPEHTFKRENLSGIVEIEWHKHEGGGGA
jgi:hypothetical protein